MGVYAVSANRSTRDGDWEGSLQLPTFTVDAWNVNEAVAKAAAILSAGTDAVAHVAISGVAPSSETYLFDTVREEVIGLRPVE